MVHDTAFHVLARRRNGGQEESELVSERQGLQCTTWRKIMQGVLNAWTSAHLGEKGRSTGGASIFESDRNHARKHTVCHRVGQNTQRLQ